MKILSRIEMKRLTGGVEFGWCTCVWSYSNGQQATVPCSYSAESCQESADTVCWADDRCSDVDCR